MKSALKTLMLAILIAAGLLAPCRPARAADEWPAPPKGWWRSLQAGDEATFEMEYDTRRSTITTTILKVEGPLITFRTRTFTDRGLMPEEVRTLHARSPMAEGAPPPRALVIRVGEDFFSAGGRTFDCTRFHIIFEDYTMEVCHSRELPPIFNGGNVWMRRARMGTFTTVTLMDYNGPLLAE